MKVLYILMASVIFVSCNKSESCDQTIKYDEIFEFILNDKFCLEDKFEFSITGISDGYCPCDRMCIWQGMMEVNLEVTSSSGLENSIFVNDSNGLFASDTLNSFSPSIIEVLKVKGDCLDTDPANYKIKMKITK